MPSYRLDIIVSGSDRATRPLSRVQRSLQRIFQIASGILVAGVIRKFTDAIGDMARTAVEGFVALEQMQIGLESLIAREMARGETIEVTTTHIKHLTESEILALDKLILKQADLERELANVGDVYDDAIEAHGDEALALLEQSIATRELQNSIAEVSGEIERMQNMEGALISTTESTLLKTLSLAEALELAKQPAQELTDWIVRLSLRSPFKEDDIVMALRVAAGYGFITQYATDLATEEERLRQAREDDVVTAQRLTVSLLDLMAAIGLPSENLSRIVLALGQVRAHGKLLAQEIRQLINAGVGIDIMAMSMGMTVEAFQEAQREGKILAEDFLPALVTFLENDLSGAAERLMQTFGGSLIALRKLARVLLREFFGPTFEAIRPKLLELTQELSSEENLERVRGYGEALVEFLMESYHWSKELLNNLRKIRDEFFISPFDLAINVAGTFFDEDVVEKVSGVVSELEGVNLELGFVDGNAEAAKGAIKGFSTVAAGQAGLGILGKILGPILGLIVGIITGAGWLGIAVAGLAAVWNGNWLGIRDKTIAFWEEDLKPAFEEIWPWLQENFPEALETARHWWEDVFLGGLKNVWEWITTDGLQMLIDLYNKLQEGVDTYLPIFIEFVEEDVVGALETFETNLQNGITAAVTLYETLNDKVSTGFDNAFGKYLDEIIPALEDTYDWWRDDYLPMLEDLVGLLDPALKEAGEVVSAVFQGFVVPAFLTAYEVINQLLEPLRFVWEKFKDLAENVLTNLAEKLNVDLVPALTEVTDFLRDPVIPILGELWALFWNVAEVIYRVAGGAIRSFIFGPLYGLIQRVGEHLNPALETWWGWVTKIAEYIKGRFSTYIEVAKSTVLLPFIEAWNWLKEGLSGVYEILKKINETLDNLELPWWALPGSPPPAAYAFWDIADAVKAASDAFENSPLSAAMGLGSFDARLGPAYALPQGTAQAQTVIVEGDTNTFNVPDRATAQFVAHMLRENKIKRFNKEALGR